MQASITQPPQSMPSEVRLKRVASRGKNKQVTMPNRPKPRKAIKSEFRRGVTGLMIGSELPTKRKIIDKNSRIAAFDEVFSDSLKVFIFTALVKK